MFTEPIPTKSEALDSSALYLTRDSAHYLACQGAQSGVYQPQLRYVASQPFFAPLPYHMRSSREQLDREVRKADHVMRQVQFIHQARAAANECLHHDTLDQPLDHSSCGERSYAPSSRGYCASPSGFYRELRPAFCRETEPSHPLSRRASYGGFSQLLEQQDPSYYLESREEERRALARRGSFPRTLAPLRSSLPLEREEASGGDLLEASSGKKLQDQLPVELGDTFVQACGEVASQAAIKTPSDSLKGLLLRESIGQGFPLQGVTRTLSRRTLERLDAQKSSAPYDRREPLVKPKVSRRQETLSPIQANSNARSKELGASLRHRREVDERALRNATNQGKREVGVATKRSREIDGESSSGKSSSKNGIVQERIEQLEGLFQKRQTPSKRIA